MSCASPLPHADNGHMLCHQGLVSSFLNSCFSGFSIRPGNGVYAFYYCQTLIVWFPQLPCKLGPCSCEPSSCACNVIFTELMHLFQLLEAWKIHELVVWAEIRISVVGSQACQRESLYWCLQSALLTLLSSLFSEECVASLLVSFPLPFCLVWVSCIPGWPQAVPVSTPSPTLTGVNHHNN